MGISNRHTPRVCWRMRMCPLASRNDTSSVQCLQNIIEKEAMFNLHCIHRLSLPNACVSLLFPGGRVFFGVSSFFERLLSPPVSHLIPYTWITGKIRSPSSRRFPTFTRRKSSSIASISPPNPFCTTVFCST